MIFLLIIFTVTLAYFRINRKISNLSVASDVKGLRVTVNRRDKIEDFLNRYHFWDQKKITLLPTNEKTTAKKLLIKLTSQPQNLLPVYAGNEILFSVGEHYDNNNNELLISVYINQKQLYDETGRSRFFNNAFYIAVAEITGNSSLLARDKKRAEFKTSTADTMLFLINRN